MFANTFAACHHHVYLLWLQTRYQGSAEERSDLLRYYKQFRGRMATVFDHLMCSEPDTDSHRLMDIIEECIAAGAWMPV